MLFKFLAHMCVKDALQVHWMICKSSIIISDKLLLNMSSLFSYLLPLSVRMEFKVYITDTCV